MGLVEGKGVRGRGVGGALQRVSHLAMVGVGGERRRRRSYGWGWGVASTEGQSLVGGGGKLGEEGKEGGKGGETLASNNYCLARASLSEAPTPPSSSANIWNGPNQRTNIVRGNVFF